MRKLTHTFPANDDQGRDYTIKVFTVFTTPRGKSGQSWVDTGVKELETADGQLVLRIGVGEYQLKRDGTVIWTNDPLAP